MVTKNIVLKSLFTLLCVFLMTVSIAVADQDSVEQDQEGKFSAFQMFKNLILKVVKKAEAENEADTSNDNAENRFEAKKKVGAIKADYYDKYDPVSVGFFAGAIQRLKGAFSNEDQRRERCYDLYEEDRERFDTDCRAFAEEVQYFIDSGEFDGTFDEAMARGNGDDYWEDKQDEREKYCRDLLHENKEEFEEECSEFVDRAEVRVELGEVRHGFEGSDDEFDDRMEYCKGLHDENYDQFEVECPEFVGVAQRHERGEEMHAMDRLEGDFDPEHAERCKELMGAEEFDKFKHECSEFMEHMERPLHEDDEHMMDDMDYGMDHMPEHEVPPMHFPEHMSDHEMKCKHLFESGDKEAFDVECRDMYGGDDHDPDIDGELYDESDPYHPPRHEDKSDYDDNGMHYEDYEEYSEKWEEHGYPEEELGSIAECREFTCGPSREYCRNVVEEDGGDPFSPEWDDCDDEYDECMDECTGD